MGRANSRLCNSSKINLEELKKSLERKLTPFEMPKEWHKGDALPTNEMGKPQIGED